MKKIYSVVFMLFALVGCSNANEGNPEHNDASNGDGNSQEINFTQYEKPPSLTISFGEETVKTSQGGYSWSYLDFKTGQMISIEADSLPSTELVNVEDAVGVNISDPIKLNFEKQPLNYEIRVYDNNNNMIATYNDLKDVKENGKAIYEILVTWEEGTGIYAVPLDVQ
ncbi:hypothetical protein CV093_05190 [Oceanobacillus sp. 143]|uniref:Lipoprotein n=1 Tax=Oceanobacillus zhaokaii TaxID=2052660 RepID=A0A345PE83_9BACI|nr:hypothetical protein [Oceanobacillus zhaokaii]AXI08313.1 hypothetical protein CUC15_04925 [Oceanobacillus zhaokaii]QGS68233.1 hypothetical protein CV093_05190 [Oceanobacillus sp. 143]